MTQRDALSEFFARLGASKGAAVLVNAEELKGWPVESVKAMKDAKLLMKAQPTSGVVCPGCEQQCMMPVHTLVDKAGGHPRSFVVCDKREDINRVDVALEQMEQWQFTGTALADLLAGLLELRRADTDDGSAGRWEIGVLKGAKGSSHVMLLADGGLRLNVAGHSVELPEILTLESKKLRVDKRALMRLIDKPVAGAGDVESAEQRRARLKKLVDAEKNKGNKAFLKTVAAGEHISVPRLKQILTAPSPGKRKTTRSAY
jgi:hypothetical protein